MLLVNKQKIVSIRQTPSFPHNATGVSLRFIGPVVKCPIITQQVN